MSLPRQNDLVAKTKYHVPTTLYLVAMTKLSELKTARPGHRRNSLYVNEVNLIYMEHN